MSETRVRRTPRLPLPRGPEHEVWVVDARMPQDRKNLSNYSTPATAWVRMAMPESGQTRAEVLLARLADFARREQGDLHDQFNADRDASAEDLAHLIFAKALMHKDTSFYVLNIEPSGRAFMFLRCRRFATWHPDAPRPNAGGH